MADATKHLSVNGGPLISDLKSLFSVLKTRRTVALAYGFMFAFVAFTVFLAFNPSPNSSAPWFTSIFSSSTTAASTSTDSYRSQFSPFFSHFFSNTSSSSPSPSPPPSPQQQEVQNFAPSLSTLANSSRSNDTVSQSLSQSPKMSNELPVSKNTTSKPVDAAKKTPGTKDVSSQPPSTSTKLPGSKNQTQSTGKPSVTSAVMHANNTKVVPSVNAQPPRVSNETQRKENSDKAEALKSNQTKIAAPVAPSAANQTGNSTPKSSSSSKGGDRGVVEKGVASNYTATLSKKPTDGTKQKNGSNSGLSAGQGIDNLIQSLMGCDLFDGEWVRDDSYPLYKAGSCSLIDEQFNCIVNGRPDKDYQKLKWKPKGCNLPRLNGRHMLELLRGKRLVFVGDSLNRNMWESLVCILRAAAKNPKRVYEAHGRMYFRGEASYSFIFKDYNCTLEFFVSPFLVREWEVTDKNGTKETLRLDLVGKSSDQYKGADIIIFNTGHWWTHEKTSKGKDYYQEGSHVYSELNVLEAFRKALTTWARWVDANVNPMKSMVFFRGYSASHFSGGQWNSGGACDSETEPIKNEAYLTPYPPKMQVLEKVLKGMKTHVTYLNITRLTDYRKDGHPSVYRKQNLSPEERKSPLRYQDCSHWCLPGVPDSWNELLYAELLVKENKMLQHQRRVLVN